MGYLLAHIILLSPKPNVGLVFLNLSKWFLVFANISGSPRYGFLTQKLPGVLRYGQHNFIIILSDIYILIDQ